MTLSEKRSRMRSIEFVLSTQQGSGMLYAEAISKEWGRFDGSHTALYNHAIAGLMLSEVYGMTDDAHQRFQAATTLVK
jgi:hypothetical protein